MVEKTIWSNAHHVMLVTEVAHRIKELREAADSAVTKLWTMDRAAIAALVLQDAVEVMQADPSDLITYRRLNCRHCHGMNHAYRWRDEAEFWEALAEASDRLAQWEEADPRARARKRPTLPTNDGGYGFTRLAPPAPGCPQCEGEGIAEARIADIRTLSGPARRLYAGVKVKKDGSLEVLTRDKDAARVLLGKYAGVVVDQVKHTGAVGLVALQLTDTEKAAIRIALEKDI